MHAATTMLSAAALCIALVAYQASAQCVFNHRNLHEKQPLMLKPGARLDVRGFITSNDAGEIKIGPGEKVYLACPGENNYMTGGNAPPASEAVASCVSGTSFTIGSRTVNLAAVSCFLWPYHTARNMRIGCEGRGTLIRVGFPLERGFLNLTDICFDDENLAAISSSAIVVAGGRATRSNAVYNAFFHGEADPAFQYQQATQTKTFTTLLGPDRAQLYITNANNLLSGFMTNKDDFVYWPQQNAMYYYINTVPQWRQFNTGYWKSLETAIRDLAKVQGDLHMITRAFGVSSLKDGKNITTPLYLYVENGSRKIPVPNYLVKEVTNQMKETMVFVRIVNRPAVARRLGDPTDLCTDVCHELGDWLPWKNVRPEERNIFCCKADDQKLLKNIPEFAKRSHLYF